MGITLPEPNYYMLDEITALWEVPRDRLFRLAAEGKLRFSALLESEMVSVDQEFQPPTRAGLAALFPGLEPDDMDFDDDDESQISQSKKRTVFSQKLSAQRQKAKPGATSLEFLATGFAGLTSASFGYERLGDTYLLSPEFSFVSHYIRRDPEALEPGEMPKPTSNVTFSGPDKLYFHTVIILAEEVRRIERGTKNTNEEDSPQARRQLRNAYRILNAIMCAKQLDPTDRNTAAIVSRYCELAGLSITDDTIRAHLKAMREAVKT